MKSTDLVDNQYIRTDVPDFASGDEVKVHVKVVEGNKERVQVFHGNVIARSGSGLQRPTRSARSATASASSAPFRSTPRPSPSSRSSSVATCAGPSCTTSVTGVGKAAKIRKSATPERARPIGVIEHPL